MWTYPLHLRKSRLVSDTEKCILIGYMNVYLSTASIQSHFQHTTSKQPHLLTTLGLIHLDLPKLLDLSSRPVEVLLKHVRVVLTPNTHHPPQKTTDTWNEILKKRKLGALESFKQALIKNQEEEEVKKKMLGR